MEEQETIPPEYLKGFNEGYTLAQHMPDMVDSISKSLPDSERSNGFKAGQEQYRQELVKEKRPTWLRRDRLDNLNHEKDHDREIDRDERES